MQSQDLVPLGAVGVGGGRLPGWWQVPLQLVPELPSGRNCLHLGPHGSSCLWGREERGRGRAEPHDVAKERLYSLRIIF